MATQNAHTFMEALEHDAGLAAQFHASGATTLDAVVDFATGKGYIFTSDDLAQELKQHPESKVAWELLQRIH